MWLLAMSAACGKDKEGVKKDDGTDPVVVPPDPEPEPQPEPEPETQVWSWSFSYAKGSADDNEALGARQPDWTSSLTLYSDQGQEAFIKAFEAEGKTATAFNTVSFTDGQPYIRGIYYHDYFLVSVPAEELPAGSTVSLKGSMAGSGSSAGFFLAEYSTDGGASWKQAGEGTETTVADAAFTYHCAPQDNFESGAGDFAAAFETAGEVTEGKLLVRLTATPNYRITRPDGSNTITTTGGGSTRLRGTWILSVTPVSGTHEGEFAVGTTSVSFPGSNYSASDVLIRTWDEEVVVQSEGLDWLEEAPRCKLEKNSSLSLSLKPSGANVRGRRSGTISVIGLTSGRKEEIAVSQDDLYEAVDGFPAKWEINASTYTDATVAGQRWASEGISVATAGSKKAYLTTVSTSGKQHRHFVYEKTIAVEGMSTDDYLLFSVPVKHVSAGTDFDFMLSLDVTAENSPQYWVFEYLDGDTWKGVDRVRKADDGTQYSFRTKYFADANHTTFIQGFTLSQAVDDDFVQVRCRVAGEVSDGGPVYLPRMTFMSCYLICYEGAPAPEYRGSLMALGNSFTYYYGSLWMLKEIARREGIQLQMTANLKGGQSFRMHLDNLEFSNWVIEQGGYDYAIMQGTSYSAADFYRDGCREDDDFLVAARQIIGKVRQYSPDATIVLEHTWAYAKSDGMFAGYGDYETFDNYLALGSEAFAARIPEVDIVSHIGPAFAKARELGYSMYYTDSFHPARIGAYLKSCVNYLTLFRKRFGPAPADCGLDAEDAAAMRRIAEALVFAPVPGEGEPVTGDLENMNPKNPEEGAWK